MGFYKECKYGRQNSEMNLHRKKGKENKKFHSESAGHRFSSFQITALFREINPSSCIKFVFFG